MKIAVISDIHDNTENLEKSLALIKKVGCKRIIFCGDMCTLFSAEKLDKAGIKTYAVLGNAESDTWGNDTSFKNFIMFPPEQEFGELELAGKRIAFSHYPKVAEELFSSNYYDAVFFGHTHRVSVKKEGNKILANPGSVCGIINGRKGKASFLIYNTSDNLLKLQEIN